MTHIFKVGDTGLTRGGCPYRVININARGKQPIVALVVADPNEETETPQSYDTNGRLSLTQSSWDLLPPEKPKQSFREWCRDQLNTTYMAETDFVDLPRLTWMELIADYLDEQALK